MQGCRCLHHDPGAKIGNHGGISDELDGVAKPLLAVKQDGFSRDITVADPERRLEIPLWRGQPCLLPAPLPQLPASLKLTLKQKRDALVERGLGEIGVDGDGTVIIGDGIIIS